MLAVFSSSCPAAAFLEMCILYMATPNGMSAAAMTRMPVTSSTVLKGTGNKSTEAFVLHKLQLCDHRTYRRSMCSHHCGNGFSSYVVPAQSHNSFLDRRCDFTGTIFVQCENPLLHLTSDGVDVDLHRKSEGVNCQSETQACVHMHSRTHTLTHTHACTHAHTHTHTQTHTHTWSPKEQVWSQNCVTRVGSSSSESWWVPEVEKCR